MTATDVDAESGTADTASDAVGNHEHDGMRRPRFRGCVICYSAAWLADGVRRLRS